MDRAKRKAMIDEALKIVRDEVLTIPLHRQIRDLDPGRDPRGAAAARLVPAAVPDTRR